MSNQISTPKDKFLALFEGILLGRTLHDLEKQAGASIEELLLAVRSDEDALLDFKAAREWGTYVQESELTTRLRENADNPQSAVKTNALKLYADHMHWAMERANPGVFSGKADLTAVVPVQFVTTLDLNAVKKLENVYDIEATIPVNAALQDLNDSEFELLEASIREAPPNSPFDAAVRAIKDTDRLETASARLEAVIEGISSSLEGSTTGDRYSGDEEGAPPSMEAARPRRKRSARTRVGAPKSRKEGRAATTSGGEAT